MAPIAVGHLSGPLIAARHQCVAMATEYIYIIITFVYAIMYIILYIVGNMNGALNLAVWHLFKTANFVPHQYY